MEWIKHFFKYGIIPFAIFSLIVFLKGGKMVYVLVSRFIYYYSDEYFLLTTEPRMPFYHIFLIGLFSVVFYAFLVRLGATVKELVLCVIICSSMFFVSLLVLVIEIESGTRNITLYDFSLPWYIGGGYLLTSLVIMALRKRHPQSS